MPDVTLCRCGHQHALADHYDELQDAIAVGEFETCGNCGAQVLPCDVTHDPVQVEWVGAADAEPYCSDQCVNAAAERAFEHASTRGVK